MGGFVYLKLYALPSAPKKMKIDFLPLEYNCKFVEKIGVESGKFKDEVAILDEYKRRGFKTIKIVNVIDDDGNVLAYTFNVYCYADPKEYKEITKDGFLIK